MKLQITEKAERQILEAFANNLFLQMKGEGQEIDNETLLMTINEMLTNDKYYEFMKERFSKNKN